MKSIYASCKLFLIGAAAEGDENGYGSEFLQPEHAEGMFDGSDRDARKKWGTNTARKLQQRLTELLAAETLADFAHLPSPRCHELKGDRAGQFAADLGHPYRLIFEPDHAPVPRTADGGVDRAQVTKVLVLEVCDYH